MKTRMIQCGLAILLAVFGAASQLRAEVFSNLTVTGFTTLSNNLTVVGNATVSGFVDANGFGFEAAWCATNSGGSFAGGHYAQRDASNCQFSVAIGWAASRRPRMSWAPWQLALGHSSAESPVAIRLL